MFYGEHLLVDEASVRCQGLKQPCPDKALHEVKNKIGVSYGWFCSRCAHAKRRELRRKS